MFLFLKNGEFLYKLYSKTFQLSTTSIIKRVFINLYKSMQNFFQKKTTFQNLFYVKQTSHFRKDCTKIIVFMLNLLH